MMDDAWKHCIALQQRRLEEEQRALGNDAMSSPLSLKKAHQAVLKLFTTSPHDPQTDCVQNCQEPSNNSFTSKAVEKTAWSAGASGLWDYADGLLFLATNWPPGS